jgi:OFA family oxalate/formate antiporter-like MFS transporter
MVPSPLHDVHYGSCAARAKRRRRWPWVERRGPRVAATAAALFFGLGLLIGGIGLALKQSYLVFLGMGVVGGIGCGLGYIAPVSTLVKWFPDRRGMATGMAIMGFGGGAFLAGYLNACFVNLLGVAKTVMVPRASGFWPKPLR